MRHCGSRGGQRRLRLVRRSQGSRTLVEDVGIPIPRDFDHPCRGDGVVPVAEESAHRGVRLPPIPPCHLHRHRPFHRHVKPLALCVAGIHADQRHGGRLLRSQRVCRGIHQHRECSARAERQTFGDAKDTVDLAEGLHILPLACVLPRHLLAHLYLPGRVLQRMGDGGRERIACGHIDAGLVPDARRGLERTGVVPFRAHLRHRRVAFRLAHLRTTD
mmetsp:Transcript_78695/g.227498  ORF Transcript_78695/g.227498 Transcript_78695/m.227498 type:complete len:217 (+) Transcript_78695:162-812(+)